MSQDRLRSLHRLYMGISRYVYVMAGYGHSMNRMSSNILGWQTRTVAMCLMCGSPKSKDKY